MFFLKFFLFSGIIFSVFGLEYHLLEKEFSEIQLKDLTWLKVEKIPAEISTTKNSIVVFRHLLKDESLFLGHLDFCQFSPIKFAEIRQKTFPRIQAEVRLFSEKEKGSYIYFYCFANTNILRIFEFSTGDFANILKSKYQDFFFRLLIYGFYFIFGIYLIILAFYPDKNRSFFLWAGFTLVFLGLFLLVRRNFILAYLFPMPFFWGYLFYLALFGSVVSFLGLASFLCPSIKAIYYNIQQIYYSLYFGALTILSFLGVFHPEEMILYFYYSFFGSVFFIVVGFFKEVLKKPVLELRILIISLSLFALFATLDLLLYLLQWDSSLNRLKWALNLLGFNIAIIISIWYYRNLQLRQRTMWQLEKKVAHRTKRLQESLEILENSLKVAREIQQKLLPDQKILSEFSCEVAVWYEPKFSVGGDFFQIHKENNFWRIFLSDTTGHDVASAMVSMLLYVEYENLQKKNLSPGKILAELNSAFVNKYAKLKTYFSALVLDIDFTNFQMSYAMGGHPEQILIKKNRSEILLNTGPILGFRTRPPWEENQLSFTQGDILVIFSDGLLENSVDMKNPLDLRDLESFLRQNKDKTAKEILEELKQKIRSLQGFLPQEDDITVVIFKF